MTAEPVRLDELIHRVHRMHPRADPLQRVTDAAELSAHLTDLADHLVGHFVDAARAAGATWADIGDHLGVTKQAVQKRFVTKPSADLDFPSGGRLSRFTGRARNALLAARRVAGASGAPEVDPLHLLLGLLTEPKGLAARAVVNQGNPLDVAFDRVTAALPAGKRRAAKQSRFGREAKKAIQLSLREALRLGHNYIGTEHLLLALLRLDGDPAAELLASLGITHEAAEAFVVAQTAAADG